MNKAILMSAISAACLGFATGAFAKDYPEFGGRCAMGVAVGKEFKTDCSVNWNSPSGDLYCFGNEKAKRNFLEDREANMQKAFDNYRSVVM